jgi:hypothetical protein
MGEMTAASRGLRSRGVARRSSPAIDCGNLLHTVRNLALHVAMPRRKRAVMPPEDRERREPSCFSSNR